MPLDRRDGSISWISSATLREGVAEYIGGRMSAAQLWNEGATGTRWLCQRRERVIPGVYQVGTHPGPNGASSEGTAPDRTVAHTLTPSRPGGTGAQRERDAFSRAIRLLRERHRVGASISR
jgi:hypothetical protein